MTLLAVCDECFREYPLDAKHAGRKFRCKHCGATVTVPSQTKKADSSARAAGAKKPTTPQKPAPPKPKAKPQPKPAAKQPPAEDEWDDYGDEEPELPPAKSTPSRKPKKSGKKRKSTSSQFGGFLGENGFTTVCAATAGGLVLLLVLGFVHKAFVLLFAVCAGLIGFGLVLVGGIWSLVVPFRESVVCGLLYLFMPFYALYYLISRWDEMWKPWVMQIAASGLLLLLALIMPFFQTFHDRQGGAEQIPANAPEPAADPDAEDAEAGNENGAATETAPEFPSAPNLPVAEPDPTRMPLLGDNANGGSVFARSPRGYQSHLVALPRDADANRIPTSKIG